MTGARAHVAPAYAWDGVSVYLLDQFSSTGVPERRIALPVELEWRTLTREEEVSTGIQPSLKLPENVARALCDGLCAHFGGTSDTVTARRDLERVWGRYDRAVDALIQIANRPTRGEPT